MRELTDEGLKVDSRHQPVWIFGSFRSGTTMLSDLLAQLGLFTGEDENEYHESMYFLETNEQVITRAGASWPNPVPVRDFLAVDDAARITAACLRADLLSWRARHFLGMQRYLKIGTIAKLDQPWGWKDPRTIWTGPLWLKLFPGARFVHIVRNGVDVASSLRVRARGRMERRVKRFADKFHLRRRRSALDRVGFHENATCLSLAGAFGMWKAYNEQAEAVLAANPANARVSFRYEDFLDSPKKFLMELVPFCGLTGVTEEAIDKAAAQVRPSRANAFLKDPELSAFYGQIKDDPWMQKYGYSALT